MARPPSSPQRPASRSKPLAASPRRGATSRTQTLQGKGSSGDRESRKPARRADPKRQPVAPESEAVADFLRRLDHPLKDVLLTVRTLILGVSPTVREELKWNAPSFKTSDHFATFNLRGKAGLRLILHRGAKSKPVPIQDKVQDPEGLAEWLGPDRALVTFGHEPPNGPALQALLRQWIQLL